MKAKALRRYMKRQGIKSQAELARRLQISEGMVSLVFKGERVFGGKTGLRISRLTAIPMEELYQ